MSTMMQRLVGAMNSHDPEAMAALFADDYRSVQPVHPARGFGGRQQVLENWTAVFRGVPDFVAELVDDCGDEITQWGEWDWRGRHADGTAFAMRGVTILSIRDGVISDMRLYMEPVDTSQDGIDAAVQGLYQPPSE